MIDGMVLISTVKFNIGNIIYEEKKAACKTIQTC